MGNGPRVVLALCVSIDLDVRLEMPLGHKGRCSLVTKRVVHNGLRHPSSRQNRLRGRGDTPTGGRGVTFANSLSAILYKLHNLPVQSSGTCRVVQHASTMLWGSVDTILK